jgi:hypothetical protein
LELGSIIALPELLRGISSELIIDDVGDGLDIFVTKMHAKGSCLFAVPCEVVKRGILKLRPRFR